ncbi:MAG: cell division protein ZipA [Gammaproteobacteria bacterium]|nr:cell division protein ZipA [Gammaproteobacteria bacterium]
MDSSTFRWILIIAGIALIAGLYLFGVRDKKRKPRASRKRVHAKRVRREPVLEPGGEESGEYDTDARQAELAIGDPTDSSSRIEPQLESGLDIEPKKPEVTLPDRIVTLFLQARDNHVITGVDLLDASLKSGLVFGDHDIFHRIHEEDVEPVFSMANLTKPGSFDKSAWNTMEIKGVTMFMTLPGPRNALDAWDSMLATSRRLAELLHADLMDDAHEVFTRQRSMQIKEELREYERQKNPEP